MDAEPRIDPTDTVEEEEVVDGELVDVRPVLASQRDVVSQKTWATPPVKTAVAAASGFIAGAATLALLNRRGHRTRELEAARTAELAQLSRRPLDSAASMPRPRHRVYLVSITPLQRPR